MKNHFKRIELTSKKQFELIDITETVKQVIAESGVTGGQVAVVSPHTTAAVRVNHNEPLLAQDIMKTLYRLVPLDVSYSHDLFEMRETVAVNERSNGHAHVEAFLLGSSETFIIDQGKLLLGGKQSIFFVELDGGRPRDYYISVVGD